MIKKVKLYFEREKTEEIKKNNTTAIKVCPKINIQPSIHTNIPSVSTTMNDCASLLKPVMIAEALLGVSRPALCGHKKKYIPILATLLSWLMVGFVMSKYHAVYPIFAISDCLNNFEYILHTGLVAFIVHPKSSITDEKLKQIDKDMKITNKTEIWSSLRWQASLSLIFFISIHAIDLTFAILATKDSVHQPTYFVFLPFLVHDLEILFCSLKFSYINIRLKVLNLYLERRLLRVDELFAKSSNNIEKLALGEDTLKNIIKHENVQIKEMLKIYADIIDAAELLNSECNPQTLLCVIMAFSNCIVFISSMWLFFFSISVVTLFTKLCMAVRLVKSLLFAFLSSFVCERGYDQVRNMDTTIWKLLTLPHISEQDKDSLQELQLVLQVRPLEYSIYGLLPFKVGCVLGFVTFCNTYVIFIMQMPRNV